MTYRVLFGIATQKRVNRNPSAVIDSGRIRVVVSRSLIRT